ncbi:MAG: putative baseplate assembly protein [Phycisphaerae bacterium]|nr:putative baseplate assembly protein [Phycisphaerae bacterium]
MIHPTPICADSTRKGDLLNSVLNGIDYVEVTANQTTLRVTFLKALPADSYGLPNDPHPITIEGGERVTGIYVKEVRRAGPRLLEVDVSGPGDFSTYVLVIDVRELDPAYARVEFSFKAACPSRFDCRPRTFSRVERPPEPPIDYLAKDYASFRQALLDYLAARAPEWRERHAADLGVTLVELLSYAADQLSYFHDAVANEPYLETARQRISVRRHARLIDYRMHDGVSARTFVHLHLATGTSGMLPAGTRVLTRIDRPLGALHPPFGHVLPAEVETEALQAAGAVFETMHKGRLDAKLNGVPIHTWKNDNCCLPRGTQRAELLGDCTDCLHPGDFLLFEEVIGPTTGNPGDADPNHRQVVRLTRVESAADPLFAQPLTRVEWGVEDALRFPLCLSAQRPDGTQVPGVSVARGNLVLADHGIRVRDDHPDDPAAGISVGARPYRFRLEQGPLSFRIPFETEPSIASAASATALLQTNPMDAKPQVLALEVLRKQGETWGPVENHWAAVQPDLFASSPFDHHFVVETDNEGRAQLRFGDGVNGQSPPNGHRFGITYRVGVGTAGNVGADSLTHVVQNPELPDIKAVRNPLPAWGGTEPETLDQVKRLAPAAFRAVQYRAVTEADYAQAAEKCPPVAKAVARFRWTGSWYTVFLSIDPRDRMGLTPELREQIREWVMGYTLAGYDLEIQPPVYVPLVLELEVCVCADHFRSDVWEAVLTALDSRRHPDGSLGFFHPDRFTFGDPLYLSSLYEAVMDVPGVVSVQATRFRRLDEPDDDPLRRQTETNVDCGYIPIGALEVLRLENDPSFPEHGMLRVEPRGGK